MSIESKELPGHFCRKCIFLRYDRFGRKYWHFFQSKKIPSLLSWAEIQPLQTIETQMIQVVNFIWLRLLSIIRFLVQKFRSLQLQKSVLSLFKIQSFVNMKLFHFYYPWSEFRENPRFALLVADALCSSCPSLIKAPISSFMASTRELSL